MPTLSPANTLLEALRGHRYLRLTTFRRTGAPVPTPVWFAEANDSLYMFSLTTAGKLKRICNNPQVKVAPCGGRGNLLGPEFDATAKILPDSRAEAVDQILTRKYGWQLVILKWLYRLQGVKRSFVEIQPASA